MVVAETQLSSHQQWMFTLLWPVKSLYRLHTSKNLKNNQMKRANVRIMLKETPLNCTQYSVVATQTQGRIRLGKVPQDHRAARTLEDVELLPILQVMAELTWKRRPGDRPEQLNT